MRSIKWAYLAQRTPAPGTVYLFIVPSFTGNPGMVGYMPLKSSYGFLTPSATVRDAAHELGHGVFNLRHTFSNDNIVTLPQSSTQNLMDYPSTNSGQVPGTELFKYQWDNIHDPEGGWFVFEDSEEGAMFNNNNQMIIDLINLIRRTNLFNNNNYDITLTPSYFGLIGTNIELEGKRYSKILLENTTPLVLGNRKFNSNIFIKGTLVAKSLSNTTVNMVPFMFKKQTSESGGYEDVGFSILVPEDRVVDFEVYLSLVTGMTFNDSTILSTATTVASSIDGDDSQCNAGLRKYILELTGDSILYPTSMGGKIDNPGQANDVVRFLEKNHLEQNGKKFHKVSFSEAVALSKAGCLIVSVLYNPIGQGHVNALLTETISGNWKWYIYYVEGGKDNKYIKSEMPLIFDTGFEKRWPNEDIPKNNRKLTDAYIIKDHSSVKFFIYLNN